MNGVYTRLQYYMQWDRGLVGEENEDSLIKE